MNKKVVSEKPKLYIWIFNWDFIIKHLILSFSVLLKLLTKYKIQMHNKNIPAFVVKNVCRFQFGHFDAVNYKLSADFPWILLASVSIIFKQKIKTEIEDQFRLFKLWFMYS